MTYAIQRTRELYAQVDLGVRKVYRTYVPEDEVGGYTTITDAAEARDLTEAWSADNDGIDAISTASVNLTAGQGATMRSHCSTRGPC